MFTFPTLHRYALNVGSLHQHYLFPNLLEGGAEQDATNTFNTRFMASLAPRPAPPPEIAKLRILDMPLIFGIAVLQTVLEPVRFGGL